MPLPFKPHSKSVIIDWLDQLDYHSEDSSSWEIDFVDSMRTTIDRYGRLTEAQQNKLESIYVEKTK
jgi:hypothetical protein